MMLSLHLAEVQFNSSLFINRKSSLVNVFKMLFRMIMLYVIICIIIEVILSNYFVIACLYFNDVQLKCNFLL